MLGATSIGTSTAGCRRAPGPGAVIPAPTRTRLRSGARARCDHRMDRSQLSHLAHRHHPISAPVSAPRAGALLRRLPLPDGGRVLDLGCGQGEWLLALLDQRPDITATGVDTSQVALSAAQQSADDRGFGDRVTWELADAATWNPTVTYDAVLSVGASHALGGLPQTLRALRDLTAPAGHALLGDGFWEVPPSTAAQDALGMTGNDMPDLPGLVDQVVAAGWLPITGHTSTTDEWDDYEWAWTGSLTQYAVQQPPGDQDAQQALAAATAHRTAWLRGYRHQYGFATLVLTRTDHST